MRLLVPLILLGTGALAGFLAARVVVGPGSTPDAIAPDGVTPHATPDATDPDARPAADLGALLADLPGAELPPRTRQILGRVVTQDGAPLWGVRITALARGTPDGARRPRPHELAIADYVQDSVAFHRWATTLNAETVSDRDGEYRLADLGEIGYRVGAELDGWEVTTETGKRNVTPSVTVNFIARPLGSLELTLTLAGGGTPGLARVRLKPRGRKAVSRHWTADAPVLELAAGRYEVQAEVGLEWRSPPAQVELEAGDRQQLALELSARSGIRGRVRFPAGAARRALVLYTLLGGDDVADPSRLADLERVGATVERERPEFVLPDLAPGRYLVAAARDPELVSAATPVQVVEVGGGYRELELELALPDPSRAVTVWVLEPGGKPARRAHLSVRLRGRGGALQSVVSEMPDGRRLLEVASRDLDRQSVPLDLQVDVPGLGSRRVPLPANGEQLEVTFTEPSLPEVHVAGATGSPFEGRLAVALGGGGRVGAAVLRALVGDRMSLGAVQPGVWTVELRVDAGGSADSVIARQRVQLASGEQRLTLPLPRLHTVTVRVPEGRPGAMALLFTNPTGSDTHRARLTDDGLAHFHDVPAGEHRLRVHHRRSYQGMTITVPAPGVIEFQPD